MGNILSNLFKHASQKSSGVFNIDKEFRKFLLSERKRLSNAQKSVKKLLNGIKK